MLVMVVSLAMAQATKARQAGKSPNALTCSPAPCVLPNVLMDTLQWGSEPRALVMNPNNPSEMVLAAEDGNCASSQGFFTTTDGGSTWSGHSCTSSNNAVG